MSYLNVAILQDGKTFSFTDHAKNVVKAIQTGDFDNLEYKGTNEYVGIDDGGLIAIDCDNDCIYSFQSYCNTEHFNELKEQNPIYEMNSTVEMCEMLKKTGFDVRSDFMDYK